MCEQFISRLGGQHIGAVFAAHVVELAVSDDARGVNRPRPRSFSPRSQDLRRCHLTISPLLPSSPQRCRPSQENVPQPRGRAAGAARASAAGRPLVLPRRHGVRGARRPATPGSHLGPSLVAHVRRGRRPAGAPRAARRGPRLLRRDRRGAAVSGRRVVHRRRRVRVRLERSRRGDPVADQRSAALRARRLERLDGRGVGRCAAVRPDGSSPTASVEADPQRWSDRWAVRRTTRSRRRPRARRRPRRSPCPAARRCAPARSPSATRAGARSAAGRRRRRASRPGTRYPTISDIESPGSAARRPITVVRPSLGDRLRLARDARLRRDAVGPQRQHRPHVGRPAADRIDAGGLLHGGRQREAEQRRGRARRGRRSRARSPCGSEPSRRPRATRGGDTSRATKTAAWLSTTVSHVTASGPGRLRGQAAGTQPLQHAALPRRASATTTRWPSATSRASAMRERLGRRPAGEV